MKRFQILSGLHGTDTQRVVLVEVGENPFFIKWDIEIIWEGELPDYEKVYERVPKILVEQITTGLSWVTTPTRQPVKWGLPPSLEVVRELVEAHVKENPRFTWE